MSTFRQIKTQLRQQLQEQGWQLYLIDHIADSNIAKQVLNPLLSFLNRPEIKWQAAWALGITVPLLAKENMEEARVLMRRLMWSMNEESGNLGWGVPEAMGCILANEPQLAKEFSHILFSYIYDTGREDNFVDHAPLRCGAFWAAGYLVRQHPSYIATGYPKFVAGLRDEDNLVQGYAIWALSQCFQPLQETASSTASLFTTENTITENTAATQSNGANIAATGINITTGNSINTEASRLDSASEVHGMLQNICRTNATSIEVFDGEKIQTVAVATLAQALLTAF